MKTVGGKLAVSDLARSLANLLLVWENPLWSAGLAGLAYSLLARLDGPLNRASLFPYYNYLADAFMHGQLHLRLLPPRLHDLAYFGGKYYLYWPPFPALVSMPFVALFGVGFSDILLTLLIASVNIGLLALLLRQAVRLGVIWLTRGARTLLVLFFAFGTVHLTLAPLGRVWYTAQLLSFTCLLLAYLAALSLPGWKGFFFTGLALSAAMLCRNHLLFAGIWPAYYLVQREWSQGVRRLIPQLLAGALPVLLAGSFLAAYNYARFGSITDFGLDYHQMAQVFVNDYRRYGPFNLYYLPDNLYYQYIYYPFPLNPESLNGGSLFLLSPVFFAAVPGAVQGLRRKESRFLTAAALASILLVSLPILLLMGTGWVQFGPRYTLDFTLPLLLLTAKGVERWPLSVLAPLVFLSIVHYLSGTIFLIGAF